MATTATTATTATSMISAVAVNQASVMIFLVIGVLLAICCAITLLDSYSSDSKTGSGASSIRAERVKKNLVLFSVPMAFLFVLFSAVQFLG